MSFIGDEEVAEQLDDDQSDHHQTDLENQIQLHGLRRYEYRVGDVARQQRKDQGDRRDDEGADHIRDKQP